MAINSYRDLIVWQKSRTLILDVYRLTAAFPNDERFGVTAQLRRATVSIATNIAEGHGRETRGEFLNQLSIARGSANETEMLLLVSQDLGFGDQSANEKVLAELNEILRMLARMRTRLKGG